MTDTDNNTNEPSFADLMEHSFTEPTRLDPGQKVVATIVRIGHEWTFLDLGAKSEGYFATSELLDDQGNRELNEGDSMTAYFLSAQKGGMLFTSKLSGGAAAQAHLEEAFRSGIPVEGTVTKEIKGGYDVKIAGTTRGFCPFSQAGLQRVEAEEFIGQAFQFKIIEYKENGRNIIISRRVLLEEEREQKMAELRETLEVGMTVRGRVNSIRNFGAFINTTDGLEGLLPISEICWGRVEDINERLTVGQEVEVEISKLDWDQKRFSFSLKNLQPDPWERVTETYQEGSTHQGTISRLAQFGAFVTLEEGVDGLLHISVIGGGRRINHPREVVQEGQNIEVKIISVDPDEKRISLGTTEALQPRFSKPGKDDHKEKEDDGRENFQNFKKENTAKPANLGTLGDLLKAKMKG